MVGQEAKHMLSFVALTTTLTLMYRRCSRLLVVATTTACVLHDRHVNVWPHRISNDTDTKATVAICTSQ